MASVYLRNIQEQLFFFNDREEKGYKVLVTPLYRVLHAKECQICPGMKKDFEELSPTAFIALILIALKHIIKGGLYLNLLGVFYPILVKLSAVGWRYQKKCFKSILLHAEQLLSVNKFVHLK